MMQYLGPIEGFIIGVLLIVYRNKVSNWLQKGFEKFPKYDDGVKALNMKFSVRPHFIIIMGVLFVLISISGFIAITFG